MLFEGNTAENLASFAKQHTPEKGADEQTKSLYSELLEKLNQFKSAQGVYDSIPDKVVIRLATPLETMAMGVYVQNSCLDVRDGENGWSAVANAVDINKQVVNAYAPDGTLLSRVLCVITKNRKLAFFNEYRATNHKYGLFIKDYIQRWASSMGIAAEQMPKSKPDNIIAEKWYDDSGFFGGRVRHCSSDLGR